MYLRDGDVSVHVCLPEAKVNRTPCEPRHLRASVQSVPVAGWKQLLRGFKAEPDKRTWHKGW